MIIKVVNIIPKNRAIKFDDFALINIMDEKEDSELQISLSYDLEGAFSFLVFVLANRFVSYFLDDYKSLIKRKERKFGFGLYHNIGRKDYGFQLVIDLDGLQTNLEARLARYFEWDQIVYEQDLSFDDIIETLFI